MINITQVNSIYFLNIQRNLECTPKHVNIEIYQIYMMYRILLRVPHKCNFSKVNILHKNMSNYSIYPLQKTRIQNIDHNR